MHFSIFPLVLNSTLVFMFYLINYIIKLFRNDVLLLNDVLLFTSQLMLMTSPLTIISKKKNQFFYSHSSHTTNRIILLTLQMKYILLPLFSWNSLFSEILWCYSFGSSLASSQFSSVAQLCLTVCDSMIPALQVSITNFRSLTKLMSIELVMPSSHLILCYSLLLLPPIPPSIRVFSNESTHHMRWPKYCSFSFSISPSNEHPGLISFRMDWLDLLAVQGTLKSLLQHPVQKHQFFGAQLSL